MSEQTVDTTTMLGEYWQELLDVDSVEPGDRLLELGGNSLTATMLANRIELALGYRPSIEQLLTSTFQELADACSRAHGQHAS